MVPQFLRDVTSHVYAFTPTCFSEHEDRTDCVDPNSFSLIYELCEGETQCVVPDDTDFFGDDVCHQTYKYTNVTFVCVCTGK